MRGLTLSLPAPRYYGWWIVLVSAGITCLSSAFSFWSFGIYIGPLEEEFGWSRAELSGAVSLMWLVTGLSGPLVGWWVDRRGARSAMLAGAVLQALTFFLLAGVNRLWQFYALYLAGSFFRSSIWPVPLNALLSRWFTWRRPQALGLAHAGFGLGGFIFIPIITYIVEEWGWRQAFLFSGVVQLAYLLPVLLLVVKDGPEAVGQEEPPADQRLERLHRQTVGPSLTLREALRTPTFWLIAVGVGLMQAGMVAFFVHAVPFFRSEGFSPKGAALVVSAITGLYAAVRATAGPFINRVPPPALAVGTSVALALGYLLLVTSTTPLALALFVPLWASAQANGPLIDPLLVGYFYGTAHFGVILGALGVIIYVGFAVGPWLAGLLYDVRGSYDLAFTILALCFLASALMYGLAYWTGRLGRTTAVARQAEGG
ncbi:Oxalate:formate antiporter [bacterium HR25]|nr:Oxalate:formate antiporter [bacterium HR25]